MSMDYTAIGTAVGGATAIIGGLVMWLRNNKLADSKAGVAIAADYADRTVYHGQAEEIKALRDRVTALDQAFVAQSARIAVLEAAHLGATSHLDNIVLCETCKTNNKTMLQALEKSLAAASKHNDTGV